jgi:trimeric autotransporter adhesin
MKKTNKLLLVSMILAAGVIETKGQNVFPTGVGTNVGIGTNAPASRLQVIGGDARFGSATNYAQHGADGDLTFTGNADFLVGGNKYAFRFSGDQDYGLYFNQTSLRYEFRDATAAAVFYASTTGDGYFAKGVQIGNSTINTPGNIRWNGTDFEGYNGSVWKSFTVTGGGAETDPQVGANTTNYVPKWNGSALVTSTIFDNATNVGIGTAAPTQKLDVVGNIKASGNVNAAGGNSTNWNSAFGWGNHASAGYLSSESDPQVGANTTSKIPRWNGSALIGGTIYDDATNIGIGTSSPTQKLHVVGNILTSGTVTATGGNSSNWNSAFGWGNHAAAGYLSSESDPQVGSNTTNYVPRWNGSSLGTGTIYDNGLVGIGTSSPSYQLHVKGTEMAVDGFGGGAGSAWNYYLINGVFKTAIGYREFENNLSMFAAGADRLVVNNSTGMVGIGTTSPFYALDVQSPNFATMTVSSTYNGGNVLQALAGGNTGNTYGIYATGPSTGYAGYFSGNVYCTGLYLGSDEKLKQNIKPLENVLDKVMKLETKTYHFKTEGFEKMYLPTEKQYGFIAQDIEVIFPELVRLNPAKGEEQPIEFKAVNYIGMIPILTEAIQELKGELNAKDAAIEELKTAMKNMESALASCCSNTSSNSEAIDLTYTANGVFAEKATLEQNAPNPFSEKTTINYYIPSDVKNALVKIYSLNGDAMKTIQVNGIGKGFVEVNGGSFAAGTYTYQLILDGKTIDTKLMVITK